MFYQALCKSRYFSKLFIILENLYFVSNEGEEMQSIPYKNPYVTYMFQKVKTYLLFLKKILC